MSHKLQLKSPGKQNEMKDYKVIEIVTFLKERPNSIQEELIQKEIKRIMGMNYIRSYVSP